MINPFKDVNWNPDLAAKRSFAKSLVIGFPCLAVALLLVRRVATGVWPLSGALWLGGVGLAAGVLFYLLPGIARPFYLAWYFVACCVGLVMSNVLVGGFFYLLLTPFGWLKRTFGRPSLVKKIDRSAPTYWHDAEKITDSRRYYRQY